MRKVTLTTGRQIDGIWRETGTTIDIDEARAVLLIAAGQALPAADSAPAAAAENRMKPDGLKR